MSRIKWFALFRNLEYKEYYNKEDALSQAPIFVIKDTTIDSFTPRGGYEWPISKYTFFDPQGKETIPTEKNWQLVDIEERFISSNNYTADFVIKDPERVIKRIEYSKRLSRKLEDTNRNNMFALIESVKILIEFSRGNSWQQYDLVKENDALKRENEVLRQRVDSLRH